MPGDQRPTIAIAMAHPRRASFGSLPLAGAAYEHNFYEQRLDYESILSRSERATAHDEEPPRHFERSRTWEDFSISFQKRKEIRSASPASELSVLKRAGNAVCSTSAGTSRSASRQ
jgi:hypothetical protein